MGALRVRGAPSQGSISCTAPLRRRCNTGLTGFAHMTEAQLRRVPDRPTAEAGASSRYHQYRWVMQDLPAPGAAS